MKNTLKLSEIKILFLGLLTAALLLSCGSFQGASYFESDGIYASKKVVNQQQVKETNQDSYYSQHFRDVADGYIPETTEETYFTDTDSYTSSNQYQPSDLNNGTGQIPWGGETAQTEIIVVNNSPNYFWGGLSSFAFRTSSFWNNYYGDSFRFGYGNFFNPFFNPYQSNVGFWRNQFFSPYYNPYSAYANFYSPYGYANFWNVNQRWGRNRLMNRYGDQEINGRDYASTVARIRSGRGEKNYEDSSNRNPENSDSKESKSNDIDVQRTINRINVGRGVNSFGRGRGISIGSLGSNQLTGNSNGNFITTRTSGYSSAITGVNRSNVNPTKSMQENSSGRISLSRNTLGARNNIRTTSPRTVRIVKRPEIVKRAAPQKVIRANTSYNSPTSRNNYNRSTPVRSYNSGSSRGSSNNSGSSTSGGSARNSSGGRNN